MSRFFFTLVAAVVFALAIMSRLFVLWIVAGVIGFLAASLWWNQARQRRLERGLSVQRESRGREASVAQDEEDISAPTPLVPTGAAPDEGRHVVPDIIPPASGDFPASDPAPASAERERTRWYRHTDPEFGPFSRLIGGWLELLSELFNGHSVLLYWINKDKKQFVLEAYVTCSRHFLLGERMAWDAVFLNTYRDSRSPRVLRVGQEVLESQLYYYVSPPLNPDRVQSLLLVPVPFDKPEPVALLVLDSREQLILTPERKRLLEQFQKVFRHTLQAYGDYFELKHQEKAWTALLEAQEALSACLRIPDLWDRLVYSGQQLSGASLIALLQQVPPLRLVRQRADYPLWTLGRQADSDSLVARVFRGQVHYHYESDLASREGAILYRAEPPLQQGSLLLLPLRHDPYQWGVLLAYHPLREYFTPVRRFLLAELVRFASLMLALIVRGRGEMEFARAQFDSDTGFFSPEGFMALARSELSAPASSRGLLLLQPDTRERLQVRYAQEELAGLLRSWIRPLEYEGLPALAWGWVGQYELAAICVDTGQRDVTDWTQQLVQKLSSNSFSTDGRQVSWSGGLVWAEEKLSVEQLLSRARSALAEAQSAGGGRVRVAR
jgi:hypothetical protein|nr:MAG: hypothetical protein KatS3mg041_1974 [Bacteroidota bacterium]